MRKMKIVACFYAVVALGTCSPISHLDTASAAPQAPVPDDISSIEAQLKAMGPAGGKLTDPKVVDLQHRKAVLLWNTGKQNDGRALLERLAKAPISNRSIMLNYAKADIQGKDALRASITMERYFDLRPKGAGIDMEAFGLFGLAMWRAAYDKTIPPVRIGKYETLKEEIERTRPGERLWGTEWVKQHEYERLVERRESAMERIRDYRSSIKRVQAEARNAEAQRPIGFRADNGTNARLESAASEIRQLDAQIDRASREMPQPTFRADLTLIQPVAMLFPIGSNDVYGITKTRKDIPAVSGDDSAGGSSSSGDARWQPTAPPAPEPNVELDERFAYRVPKRAADGTIIVPTGAFIISREKMSAGRIAILTIGPRIDELTVSVGNDISITFNTAENPNQFSVNDRIQGRARNVSRQARLNPRDPNKISIEITDKKFVIGLNDVEIYTQSGNFAQLKGPMVIAAGGDIARNAESLQVTDIKIVETRAPLPF